MERRNWEKVRIVAWAALALAAALVQPAQAQTFRVLYTFTGGADGGTPEAPLLLHGSRLYGTTIVGGSSNNGVVFQFDLKTGQQTVVHNFAGSPSDGSYAAYAGLFADGAGDLYGVTAQCGGNGQGTVFELSPSGVERLWSLEGRNSGEDPQSAPVRDSSGTYGTAYARGSKGAGTVFKLGKSRSLIPIHAFNIRDGGGPTGAVVLINGFLYGATYYGGVDGAGVIYKVNVATGATTVLYSFTGAADGGYPHGGLAADAAGNLYGTTSVGGLANPACDFDGPIPGCGTIFKLDTSGNLTTLYSFGGGSDGADCWGTLVLDAQGNLYGTTNSGGTVSPGLCEYGCGTVFKLDTAGNFTTLHSFQGGANGGGMLAGVTLGPGGVIFGATDASSPGYGVVFALKP